jgi:hypothetical protein
MFEDGQSVVSSEHPDHVHALMRLGLEASRSSPLLLRLLTGTSDSSLHGAFASELGSGVQLLLMDIEPTRVSLELLESAVDTLVTILGQLNHGHGPAISATLELLVV